MTEENITRAIKIMMFLLLASATSFILTKYVLPAVLPFPLALLTAALLQRPLASIEKKTKVPKKISAALLVAAFTAVSVLAVFFFAEFLVRGARAVINVIEQNNEALAEIMRRLLEKTSGLLSRLGIKDENSLPSVVSDAIREAALSAVSLLTSMITRLAGGFPGTLFFLFVYLISSIYFSADYKTITASLGRIMPEPLRKYASTGKKQMALALKTAVRSYLLLFLLTFGVLSLGLVLIKTESAIYTAFFISLVDVLPVLGTGIILVPWGLFRILLGETARGVALIALWIASTLMRQLLEPRIVGSELGIGPALSLVSMYVGVRAFGFWGLILAPVAVSVVKNTVTAVKGDRP